MRGKCPKSLHYRSVPLKMSIVFVLLRKYRLRSCELGKKIQTANSIRDAYDPPFGGSSDLKEPVWEP